MGDRVFGYILIVAGIVVMMLAATSVYSVFTGSSQPFALFNFKPVSIPLNILVPEMPVQRNAANFEIFPAEILNSTTNTLAHLFLMGFVVSVGFKLAMIGVNLVRPITVKMDGKKVSSVLDSK